MLPSGLAVGACRGRAPPPGLWLHLKLPGTGGASWRVSDYRWVPVVDLEARHCRTQGRLRDSRFVGLAVLYVPHSIRLRTKTASILFSQCRNYSRLGFCIADFLLVSMDIFVGYTSNRVRVRVRVRWISL